MRRHPALAFVTLVSVSMMAILPAGSRADVVISDGTFAEADWIATAYFTPTPATGTASQAAAGGNPDAYRTMSHGIPGFSTVGISHRYLPVSYTPSIEGAIDSLSYREDRIQFHPPFPGAAIGANAAVFQGGVPFFGGSITFSNLAWSTLSVTGLKAADFTSALGAHPDFSATGGTLHFGYARSNTNSGGTGYGTQHGIDNWSFTVHSSQVAGVEAPPIASGGLLRSLGPNPSAGEVEFVLSRPRGERVMVEVLDLGGRRVRTLAGHDTGAGEDRVRWDGRDANGRRVDAGVYFVRARAATTTSTVRVTILK